MGVRQTMFDFDDKGSANGLLIPLHYYPYKNQPPPVENPESAADLSPRCYQII